MSAEQWYDLGCELEEPAPDRARQAYTHAVALDPEHEKAARSLARVEALPDPVEKTEPTLAIAGPATPTIDEEASDDEAR